MQEFPNKQTIERLRKTYPAGTRVELVSMSDPFTKLTPGEQGVVQFVDDIGTIFVNWDCGSGLGVLMARIRSAEFRAIPTYTPAPLRAGKFYS